MNGATAIAGFAVMVAYWPGLSGAATSPRWAAIAACAVLVLVGPRMRVTAAHLAGALFYCWCAVTLCWSAQPLDSVGAMGYLTLMAVAFGVGAQLDTLRPVMLGAALGLTISSAIAVPQYFGWDGIPGWASGLFYNKNFLAEATALVLIFLIAERMWWLIPGLLPAIVLPQARGAWLAIVAALLVLVWRRSRTGAVIAALAGTAAMAFALLRVPLYSSAERLAIWRDTSDHLTLFGQGVGSFAEEFPAIAHRFVMTRSRPDHAHNEILNAAFETGFVGAALLLAFLVIVLRGPVSSARLVLLGITVEAMFAFPFHMPATAFIGLCVAGHVARDLPDIRDAIARGRMALHACVQRRARPAGSVS